MQILGIMDGLGELIGGIFNLVWMIFCWPIYFFIKILFNVFMNITQLDILSNTNISDIYQRITMILTIIMTFYIMFEFVKYTVNPNTISEKDKGAGSLFIRIMVTIIMITFVPIIFEKAYELQNKLISTQVFSKIILGQESIDIKNYGSNFAGDTFSAFFRVDYDNCGKNCAVAEQTVNRVVNGIKKDGSNFTDIIIAFWEDLKDFSGAIRFDGLLALIYGGFTLYILVMYCVDVGVRYIQLLYLQLIAPIAIVSYIAPQKDGMFGKWAKQCVTTYLDLFIRLSIMYFMLAIMQILSEELKITELSQNGDDVGIFVYLFLIMGLLVFAQKAPKMLQELFPGAGGAASIGFGFGTKSRSSPITGAAGALMASSIVGANGLRKGQFKTEKGRKMIDANGAPLKGWKRTAQHGKNFLDSAAGFGKTVYEGTKAGAKSGNPISGAIKGIKSSSQEVNALEKHIQSGGTTMGGLLGGTHYLNAKAKMDLDIAAKQDKIKLNESEQKVLSAVKSAQDNAEDRSKKKIEAHEQKITVSDRELTEALSKIGVAVNIGETTSQIYAKFEAATNAARARADAYNQEYVKAKAAGDEERAERLLQLAAIEDNNAVTAAANQAKALKELERYAITKGLSGQVSAEEMDGVLQANIETAKSAMHDLSTSIKQPNDSGAALRAYLLEQLRGESEYQGIYNAIENLEEIQVKSYDEYDKIQALLSNYSSKLNNENATLNQEIRQIQESEEYSKASANAGNGGSNK